MAASFSSTIFPPMLAGFEIKLVLNTSIIGFRGQSLNWRVDGVQLCKINAN